MLLYSGLRAIQVGRGAGRNTGDVPRPPISVPLRVIAFHASEVILRVKRYCEPQAILRLLHSSSIVSRLAFALLGVMRNA
jgi:hypothetical protein